MQKSNYSFGSLICSILILLVGGFLMWDYFTLEFFYIIFYLIMFSPPLIGVIISINKPFLGNKLTLIFSVIHLVIGVPLMGIYLLLMLGMSKGTVGDIILALIPTIIYFSSALSLVIISSIKSKRNSM